MKTVIIIIILVIAVILLMGLFPVGGDYTFGLPGEFEFGRTNGETIAVFPNQIIPSIIEEVGWDNRYILAKLSTEQYWILDSTQEELAGAMTVGDTSPKEGLWGPLSEEEFNQKKQELGIAENIKLRDPARCARLSWRILNICKHGLF